MSTKISSFSTTMFSRAGRGSGVSAFNGSALTPLPRPARLNAGDSILLPLRWLRSSSRSHAMRLSFLLLPLVLIGCADTAPKPAADDSPIPNRPKVAGNLRLTVRERKPDPAKKDQFIAAERAVEWDVSKTAIIICDMWDD